MFLVLELFLKGCWTNFNKITVIWVTGIFYVLAHSATSHSDIERHLELGRNMLARGQLADALTHYHAAVGKWIAHHNLLNKK